MQQYSLFLQVEMCILVIIYIQYFIKRRVMNIKIGMLLLCACMYVAAKDFGKMNLNQIESISYDKLSAQNQDELIKLAIFSGNLGHIVPGTLAHSYAAREVLENKFGPQNWIKLDFMLTQKGINAVKNALQQGSSKQVAMPLPEIPERRPMKIEEGEAEPVKQTPPPLPPRPVVTSENKPARPFSAADLEVQAGKLKQTPPPLPPRPVAQETNKVGLSFSAADLEEQAGKLKPVTQVTTQQEGMHQEFNQQLQNKFKNAQGQDEDESDTWED